MAKKSAKEESQPSFEFPTWLYHKDHGGVIFMTAEDFIGCGDGWSKAPITKKEEKVFTKPLEKMNLIELIAEAKKFGLDESEYQGRSKEEIIKFILEK